MQLHPKVLNQAIQKQADAERRYGLAWMAMNSGDINGAIRMQEAAARSSKWTRQLLGLEETTLESIKTLLALPLPKPVDDTWH